MRIRISKNLVAAAMAAATTVTVTMPVSAYAAPGDADWQASVTPSTIDAVAAAAAPFRLANQKSGKLAQPQGGSWANGTKVVQQPDSGIGEQRWIIVNDGSYISLQNYSANPAKNMGINGGSTASGASAIIANPGSGSNQDWKVLWIDSTWFRLQNRNSGMCLGISGASTANGALAAQFPCANPIAPNQTWKFF
ncbi:RICIN domain-containing protein [Micromonospora sp. LOL_024]|uniref:RICIN domain-containing protein n=1 Tax=Micromonospora sp. LOL_024 TaxID=3345412 RepID=UPI003A8A1921